MEAGKLSTKNWLPELRRFGPYIY